MVKELVRRGYNSDPVKAWKLIQDKESVLVIIINFMHFNQKIVYFKNGVKQFQLDEAQGADETEEEESTPSSSATSKDDDNLDFDYLLGMSFWHLTLEKKNELLRKKDEKCTELNILQQKTPSDLWIEDLDAFIEKVIINFKYIRDKSYFWLFKFSNHQTLMLGTIL